MKPTLSRSTPHSRRLTLLSVAILCACLLCVTRARAEEPPPEPDPPNAPSIKQVRRAALSYNQMDEIDDAPTRRRMRRAHLLPRLEIKTAWRSERDAQNDYRESLSFDDLGAAHQESARHEEEVGSSAQGLYSLTLRFDLSGLVFAPRELELDRRVEQRRERRQAMLSQINGYYYERAYRMARLQALDLDEEERLTHHHDIARCEAELDALTGGWFTSHTEGPDHVQPTQP